MNVNLWILIVFLIQIICIEVDETEIGLFGIETKEITNCGTYIMSEDKIVIHSLYNITKEKECKIIIQTTTPDLALGHNDANILSTPTFYGIGIKVNNPNRIMLPSLHVEFEPEDIQDVSLNIDESLTFSQNILHYASDIVMELILSVENLESIRSPFLSMEIYLSRQEMHLGDYIIIDRPFGIYFEERFDHNRTYEKEIYSFNQKELCKFEVNTIPQNSRIVEKLYFEKNNYKELIVNHQAFFAGFEGDKVNIILDEINDGAFPPNSMIFITKYCTVKPWLYGKGSGEEQIDFYEISNPSIAEVSPNKSISIFQRPPTSDLAKLYQFRIVISTHEDYDEKKTMGPMNFKEETAVKPGTYYSLPMRVPILHFPTLSNHWTIFVEMIEAKPSNYSNYETCENNCGGNCYFDKSSGLYKCSSTYSTIRQHLKSFINNHKYGGSIGTMMIPISNKPWIIHFEDYPLHHNQFLFTIQEAEKSFIQIFDAESLIDEIIIQDNKPRFYYYQTVNHKVMLSIKAVTGMEFNYQTFAQDQCLPGRKNKNEICRLPSKIIPLGKTAKVNEHFSPILEGTNGYVKPNVQYLIKTNDPYIIQISGNGTVQISDYYFKDKWYTHEIFKTLLLKHNKNTKIQVSKEMLLYIHPNSTSETFDFIESPIICSISKTGNNCQLYAKLFPSQEALCV
eukprot:TRINITY_DN13813_c0_g1_i1.p1 TRINITY_DN13813_c0_g1~~TRINITY_DN13813_c0_g1_i1.p1  ORF type:complete len:680 (-),score=145.20 TRINITY_DN13813_c0_g1_i1:24-2063(-)